MAWSIYGTVALEVEEKICFFVICVNQSFEVCLYET